MVHKIMKNGVHKAALERATTNTKKRSDGTCIQHPSTFKMY